jgi:hypothetical protein
MLDPRYLRVEFSVGTISAGSLTAGNLAIASALAKPRPEPYKDFFFFGGPYDGQRKIRPAEQFEERIKVPASRGVLFYDFNLGMYSPRFSYDEYTYSRRFSTGFSSNPRIEMHLASVAHNG